MKRIDMVRKILEELPQDAKITASELSEQLRTSRTNASSDLNKLCADGIAQKFPGKPVYYALAHAAPRQRENEFDLFIKHNASLFHCSEQAKAAVLYPPHGMHMLLFGETGVGKSMFAKLIFAYAQSQNRMGEGAPFVTFNCADYANNPQFLLSQLFGSVKGAYTGADKDRKGLLEHADGGMLFLDEIHRLPPEGQEMLFSFIDGGVFRRLGEAERERTAQVTLVCATTENPESALLQTFTRRIPMMISVPSLRERTIEERLYLISNFFTSEAVHLGSPIQVSANTMRALLNYECPGNIGQLKTDIQIICARAYSGYILKQNELLQISSYSLPVYIRNGLFSGENRQQTSSLLSGVTTRFITFDAQDHALPFQFGLGGDETVYQVIERRMQDMQRIGVQEEEIQRELSVILDDYYRRYSEKSGINGDIDSLQRFVGTEVLATVDKVVLHVSRTLNCVVRDNLRYGLAIHINNAIRRIRQGKPIVNPRLSDIQRDYPDVFRAAQECLDIISDDFRLTFPPDEAGFLTLFFSSSEARAEVRQVAVIVAAHGASTATSMADTANRLLGKTVVHGFDASLDEDLRAVYLRIREHFEQLPQVREILLLVDMGSLAEFARELERDLNVRAKSFVLTSTLHVLEAGRKALLGYSLPDVYEDTKRVNELALSGHGGSSVKEENKKLYLLCVCTTGHGVARVMQDTLATNLDLKGGACEIVAQQFTDRWEFNTTVSRLEEAGRVICVVGAFKTDLSVPHFDIMSVVNHSGLPAIQKIIDLEAVFAEITKTLAAMLTGLDGRRAAKDIRVTIERMEQRLNIALEEEMLVGICCHMGCMLERLKNGEGGVPFKKKDAVFAAHPNELAMIEAECKQLGAIYGVEIPRDEACFLVCFFLKIDLM